MATGDDQVGPSFLSNCSSNCDKAYRFFINEKTYEVYKRIVLPQYTAKKVAEELDLSKSTVHYHIKKLEQFNLIKCINDHEKVKFYEKTVEPHFTPVKGRGSYLVSSNGSGRGPKYGSLQPDIRHKKQVTINNNGKREDAARVHAVAYRIPILKKYKNKYLDITWDKKSSPNNRFDQFTKKVNIKEIGSVSFKWIHTTKRDTLTAYLPTLYLMPHELDDLEKIIDEYIWKAFRFFIKKEHVGLERIPERIGKYHIAYPASEKQKKYIKEQGTLSVPSPHGKMMVDDSMKNGGEVETDNIADAKLYNEVREDLLKPQIIRALEQNVDHIHEQTKQNGKQAEDLETFSRNFANNFSQYISHEQKRWEEQQQFNEQVVRYMERTDGRIIRIMREIGLTRFPTKQTTLQDVMGEEQEEGIMFG
jgi:DNA-binding Lrp family transcriptional regulator